MLGGFISVSNLSATGVGINFRLLIREFRLFYKAKISRNGKKKIRKKNLESNQQFSKTRDRFYQVNLGRIMSAFGVILGIFTSTQLVC